ncbi:MAG: RagB/SusD family nutrient uptake outer membrane protein [Bacteroidales bacterium]|nr:RagB/SusD family nutrient uptake outer membrane protein [Bacteroidales bacterium]MCF8345101.1 RagB/SusD family nutrient uptake outer membrane protein [Bacteroidales bacterium]MCF8350013.1 RagB/SusD family nutrient uptake outer membrane protein [Bacteroidales bacterium]MCF8376358.1 RagB/SusD family nutrient uptake outer membrane protein [Bacteroidales bacterium]MCF8400524.1 RagB/SusD family nutrient uptake outer membrane protein [Bacteroidales bacterium]
MKRISNISILIAALALIVSSCSKDLDTTPLDPEVVTAADIFDNPAAYKQVLAKLYAGLAVSGQDGPAGNADIAGIDEGFGQYLRGYWYHQEFPTDEAVIAWNDQTIKDFHWQSWGSSDVFITAMYYRIFYQIAACNEFIRETTDAKLDERGVSGQLRTDIGYFRAEARFLRALSYWHAMDLFANPPFVTEKDKVGYFFPEQIQRADLFEYIEQELLDIEPMLIDARMNEYGRADKGAAWTLLAKLYLNAEVYAGEARYTDCITYCNRVIDAGYALAPEYDELFLADNGQKQAVVNEIIYSINFDGIRTTTYGGTNFIIHAAIGGEMTPLDYGVADGWGGLRTTSAFVDLFPDETGEDDKRAMFFTEGQSKEINDISLFTDGYAVTKFKNITSEGVQGSDPNFVDTDFPMFRLGDVYLMYAEAVLRGGAGGDQGTALAYVNDLRERAEAETVNELTLDFILDERARELYWECHRRTDLVRYGLLTGGEYLWPWKGNAKQGIATDDKYNIFPIPASDISANPNLTQNPDY